MLPEPAPSGYVIVGDADVVWVDRKNDGEALVQAVTSSAFDASDHFGKDPAQVRQSAGVLGGVTASGR